MIPRASTRSSVVLPLSASAKQSRCGSAARSTLDPGEAAPRRRRSGCRRAGPGRRPDVVEATSPGAAAPAGTGPGPRRGDRGHERRRVGVAGAAGRGEHGAARRPAAQPVARPGGHRGGAPPVDLGLRRLAQPQLDAAAEQVLERGPQLAPPVGRHREVQAVGQSLRSEREQRRLQVVELAAQHQVAVDDEQQVGGRLVGNSPAARRARNSSTEASPASRNSRSRRASAAVSSATMRRTRSGCWRSATVPTCGRPASGLSAPPPKSSTWTPSSAGVWVSASAEHAPSPARSTCPPAARRRRPGGRPRRPGRPTSGSRRCR